VSCCLSMDGCETRPALTVSFRLERGGQFESGFQEYLKQMRKTIERTAEDVQDIKLRVADLEHHRAYSAVKEDRLQTSVDQLTERFDLIEKRLEIRP